IALEALRAVELWIISGAAELSPPGGTVRAAANAGMGLVRYVCNLRRILGRAGDLVACRRRDTRQDRPSHRADYALLAGTLRCRLHTAASHHQHTHAGHRRQPLPVDRAALD